MHRVSFLKVAVMAAAMFIGAGSAYAVNSAVVHIGVDDTGSFGIDNIVNYLNTDGRFGAGVTAIDVDNSGVPTLAALSAFDSVLVVTDNRAGTLTGGGLGTQLGNVLDDYVNQGGWLTLSTFAGNSDIGVDGDILNLSPATLNGFNATAGNLNLPPIVADPIFTGVTSWSSAFASDIGVSANGVLLADYASGTPGVLKSTAGNVFFVNGYPAAQSGYTNGTDFGLLFANSLAMDHIAVPEPASATLVLLSLGGLVMRRNRGRSRAA